MSLSCASIRSVRVSAFVAMPRSSLAPPCFETATVVGARDSPSPLPLCELFLGVDADEWRRPRRVVGRAVDEDLAVEGDLTRRGGRALLPLAARAVYGRLERPDGRPRHVERDLMETAELIPGDPRTGCG